jgi:hypothetical protein
MKVELYLALGDAAEAEPGAVTDLASSLVASVSYREGAIEVDCEDQELAAKIQNAYRRIPVVTDDHSYRRLGTYGEVLVQPGDLEWFRAVSFVRVPSETGLLPRFVPGITEGGYDPASGYRRFEEQIERLSARSDP